MTSHDLLKTRNITAMNSPQYKFKQNLGRFIALGTALHTQTGKRSRVKAKPDVFTLITVFHKAPVMEE